MIVVVIIGVLASVALVAYRRHIRAGRVVEGKTFVATIQASQETYFQRFGWYCSASPSNTTYYPAMGGGHCAGGGSEEPCPKLWNDTSNPAPNGWLDLGARPDSGRTYFEWLVIASNPSASHALDTQAAALGVPAQPASGTPHPWYYIVGRADMNSSGVPCSTTNCTTLTATSARSEVIVRNEGQ